MKIPRRILGSLLNSAGSGVVPRVGLEYIAIGRAAEIEAVTRDLELVADGGGACRFIIGRYGSGKSFLLQLIRSHCLERGFVCADSDLSPEHKLCGGSGQGLATYRRLAASLSSRSSPEGGAAVQIISKWLTGIIAQTAAESLTPGSPEFNAAVREKIFKVTSALENHVLGFDFALVLEKYYNAHLAGDEEGKAASLRWIRGEYSTKTEARADLGVGSVINDANWYDFIALLAVFVRLIGYLGLILFIDECVNLYKTPNRISRENNYEKILSIFNDTVQGRAAGLGVYFGGTPQFLEDQRRGLYSYEALRSRLADSRFGDSRYRSLIGPVLRLERLSDDEIFALAIRVRALHTEYYSYEPSVSDEQILAYLKEYFKKVGAKSLITPREIIRDLLALLDIMYQNPEASFTELAGGIKAEACSDPDALTGADIEAEDGSPSTVAFKTAPYEIEM